MFPIVTTWFRFKESPAEATLSGTCGTSGRAAARRSRRQVCQRHARSLPACRKTPMLETLRRIRYPTAATQRAPCVAERFGPIVSMHQLRGELVDRIPSGIRVFNLDRRRTRHDVAPLARYLHLRRPDILLANIDHKNIAAILARILSTTGTKVVITQHNPLSGEHSTDGRRYRIVAPIYRILAPFISAAVAVSDGVARELVTLAGLPQSKVVRIYNAVIDEGFEERSRVPIAHPWFSDCVSPVFVSAARLVPQKDHETLIRAMAIYRRRAPGRLLILGAGPLREHLEHLASELRVTDVVDFVGYQDNPLPWFRRADIFVASSRSEGFGIALTEAMGCGTPVISTDSGHGPAEILSGGRYGVLVPPQDPAAMAAALGAAAETRRRFPRELLEARAGEFSGAACVAGYLALFERLVPHRELCAV
jgi:glycosyltransferase involved in cell wall biosynthesis